MIDICTIGQKMLHKLGVPTSTGTDERLIFHLQNGQMYIRLLIIIIACTTFKVCRAHTFGRPSTLAPYLIRVSAAWEYISPDRQATIRGVIPFCNSYWREADYTVNPDYHIILAIDVSIYTYVALFLVLYLPCCCFCSMASRDSSNKYIPYYRLVSSSNSVALARLWMIWRLLKLIKLRLTIG